MPPPLSYNVPVLLVIFFSWIICDLNRGLKKDFFFLGFLGVLIRMFCS